MENEDPRGGAPGSSEPKGTSRPSGAIPWPTPPNDPPEAQQLAEVTTGTSNTTITAKLNVRENTTVRRDKGRLHSVRHGALARHPLEALRHLGEDPKALRRLERRFRADLRPSGAIADLLFDRFWSSYLRCLLAARAETNAFVTVEPGTTKAARVPKLIQGDPPALMIDDDQESNLLRQTLAPDVLRQLLLVQRYDRHFSREMYHALALLLVLRAHGEAGLEQPITRMVGISTEGTSAR